MMFYVKTYRYLNFRLAHMSSTQFFSIADPELEILYDFGDKASDGESWSLLPEPETRSDGL